MIEIILKEGKLFDMVCNNMSVFVKRKDIRYLSIRTDALGEEWAVLLTNLGKSYLIYKHDIRKYRLKYLINKIKNNGN